jgi:hypothetical protein
VVKLKNIIGGTILSLGLVLGASTSSAQTSSFISDSIAKTIATDSAGVATAKYYKKHYIGNEIATAYIPRLDSVLDISINADRISVNLDPKYERKVINEESVVFGHTHQAFSIEEFIKHGNFSTELNELIREMKPETLEELMVTYAPSRSNRIEGGDIFKILFVERRLQVINPELKVRHLIVWLRTDSTLRIIEYGLTEKMHAEYCAAVQSYDSAFIANLDKKKKIDTSDCLKMDNQGYLYLRSCQKEINKMEQIEDKILSRYNKIWDDFVENLCLKYIRGNEVKNSENDFFEKVNADGILFIKDLGYVK